MPDPVYTLAVEFVSNSFTNITNDCLRASVSRGMHSLDLPLRDSNLQVILNNNQNGYSPLNESASYFGLLKLNTAIELSCTYDSSSYWLFRGKITDISLDLSWPKTASITAGDGISLLLREKTRSELYENIYPSSLFSALISTTDVASHSIDGTFPETIPFAWWNNVTVASAIKNIIEYGSYWTYYTAGGTLTLKDRYIDVSSTVTNSYSEFRDLTFKYDDSNVVNNQIVRVRNRLIATNVSTIAFITPDELTIAASGFLSFYIDYVDESNSDTASPSRNVITPQNSIDYLAFTGPVMTGNDKTSTVSVSIDKFAGTALCSLFNGSDEKVYLSKFVLRGESMRSLPDLSATAIDNSSQNVYGKREHVIDNPLISDLNYGQVYADYLLSEKKEPTGKISIGFKNIYPDVLSLELSNTLHIQESTSGVNSLFYIGTIDHEINLSAGIEHSISLNLYEQKERTLLILDQNPEGTLGGERRLGV